MNARGPERKIRLPAQIDRARTISRLRVRTHGEIGGAGGKKAARGRFGILSGAWGSTLNARAKRHAPRNAGRDRVRTEDIGPQQPHGSKAILYGFSSEPKSLLRGPGMPLRTRRADERRTATNGACQ